MTEVLAWILVVGLAAAIAAIFMLASRLEKHSRDTLEAMYRSNEMILAQLERLGVPRPGLQDQPAMLLERRRAQRRAPDSRNAVAEDRRRAPSRRLEDFASS